AGAEAAHGHAAQQKDPEPEEQKNWEDPGQDGGEEVLVGAAAELDAVLLEFLRELGVHPGGHELAGLARLRILDLAADPRLGNQQLVDPALLEIGAELTVGQILGLLRLLEDRLENQDAEDGEEDVPGIEVGFLVHVAPPPCLFHRCAARAPLSSAARRLWVTAPGSPRPCPRTTSGRCRARTRPSRSWSPRCC